jgi:hypothetical protein
MAQGRRGHTVLGVFGGLLFGFGLAVLLQQAGLYPLNGISGYVLPLVMAILGFILGRTAPFGGKTSAPSGSKS